MAEFQPNILFRNPHIQSICASTGPRKILVRQRARALQHAAKEHILDCGNGVRLRGLYSSSPAHDKGLVILIHGWLGSDESLYLLSTGQQLFALGYNIFRLNLRDHGNSHHLNKELFNSTRLDEVVYGVREVQQLLPHEKNFLCGFSLGGNFSLRVAAQATAHSIQLDKTVAVCPVINPYKTNRQLHDGLFIYHQYFRNKWRRSLLRKLDHFPEHNYRQVLNTLKTLDDMNDYFVPNHTDYDDVNEYLHGYAIGGDRLQSLDTPCHIISSADDPVIAAADLQELPDHPQIHIELTQFGGHCGYINGFKLDSWIDRRIANILATTP